MTLWQMQPTWLKRLRLFADIVWRRWEDDFRIGWSLAWDVAAVVYPYETPSTDSTARQEDK